MIDVKIQAFCKRRGINSWYQLKQRYEDKGVNCTDEKAIRIWSGQVSRRAKGKTEKLVSVPTLPTLDEFLFVVADLVPVRVTKACCELSELLVRRKRKADGG